MINKLRLFIVCLFIILILPRAGFSQDKNIAVILSRQVNQYETALSGFKQELQSQNVGAVYLMYYLFDQNDNKQKVLSELTSKNIDLIYAVGTEAALFAKENFPKVPTVFSMVLNPMESGIVSGDKSKNENITGVSLEISIEEQFKKLKEVIPGVKKIGMLYQAQQKEELKNQAQKAANDLGLELISKSVESFSELTNALNDVLEQADCLWAGVDTFIYNSQSAQHILLETLRSKVPFMAFSSNYVNAGALLALECDYMDIGQQSADIAIKILNGKNLADLPIELPRKTKFIINKNTAKVIDVTLPDKVFNN